VTGDRRQILFFQVFGVILALLEAWQRCRYLFPYFRRCNEPARREPGRRGPGHRGPGCRGVGCRGVGG
jgi:hypothetical protein